MGVEESRRGVEKRCLGLFKIVGLWPLLLLCDELAIHWLADRVSLVVVVWGNERASQRTRSVL